MEISDDVRMAARDVLDMHLPSHNRWCKHHYTAPMRRVCLWQGIDQLQCAGSLKSVVSAAVAEVIRGQYPKFNFSAFAEKIDGTEATITGFNDHWSIHYADIRRVLEKVAAG